MFQVVSDYSVLRLIRRLPYPEVSPHPPQFLWGVSKVLARKSKLCAHLKGVLELSAWQISRNTHECNGYGFPRIHCLC